MSLDVAAIRAQFPVLDQTVHGKPLVFLDSAASAQRPQAVIDAVKTYEERDHANVHRGVHNLSQRATEAFERGRQSVARFLGAASKSEVVFTRGTTEVESDWATGQPRRGGATSQFVTPKEPFCWMAFPILQKHNPRNLPPDRILLMV